jgi:uncharacterized paraquat-inducible protein A
MVEHVLSICTSAVAFVMSWIDSMSSENLLSFAIASFVIVLAIPVAYFLKTMVLDLKQKLPVAKRQN